MAIRIRTINGTTVALCAAETDPVDGDIYIDDSAHYALAAKFCLDWQGKKIDWKYLSIWRIMESQKKRNAEQELIKWTDFTKKYSGDLDFALRTLNKIANYNLDDSDPLRDCAMRQWAKECYDKLKQ